MLCWEGTTCFPELVQISRVTEGPCTRKLEENIEFLGAAENISSHNLELKMDLHKKGTIKRDYQKIFVELRKGFTREVISFTYLPCLKGTRENQLESRCDEVTISEIKNFKLKEVCF